MTCSNKSWQYFLMFVILGTTLFYTLATGHIWEDFFITFKHSKNLIDGYGLVYQPGEKVHGFTSVINTLLPAFFYWISGKELAITLWLYKTSSIIALIFGAWYFLNEYQKKHANSLYLLIFFPLLLAFEAKTIMFTTNGQEAGFMLLFLLPSLIFSYDGYKKNWCWAGICWAGLIYTRPDGVIYIAILAIIAIVFGQSKTIEEYKAILKSAVVCGLLYLPWFIGAWLYYGSPVPHTIIAKSSANLSDTGNIITSIQSIIVNIYRVGPNIFQPTYYNFGGWPNWVKIYSFISWIVCFTYFLIPTKDRFGRFVSLAFALLVFYFAYINHKGGIAPWYLPPAAILGSFILISASSQLTKSFSKNYRHIVLYFLCMIFFMSSTSIYFKTVVQMQAQQEIIENGNRKKIGLWLNKNIALDDTVFLESLGYIGYFSNAKMLDWPGLASPEVVYANKSKNNRMSTDESRYINIIKKLKPSWIVIRPNHYSLLMNIKWIKMSLF